MYSKNVQFTIAQYNKTNINYKFKLHGSKENIHALTLLSIKAASFMNILAIVRKSIFDIMLIITSKIKLQTGSMFINPSWPSHYFI